MSRLVVLLALGSVGCRVGDGTILVDQSELTGRSTKAPVPEITAPARGDWLTATETVVQGRVRARGLETVTINGVAATLGPRNTFSLKVPVEPGINTYHVVARDRAGREETRRVSVIGGSFVSNPLAAIPAAQVAVNAVGLEDAAADISAGLVDLVVLSPGAPLLAIEDCVALEGTIVSFTADTPVVALAGGEEVLDTTVLWSEVRAEVEGVAHVCGEDVPFTLEMVADAAIAETEVSLDPSGDEEFAAYNTPIWLRFEEVDLTSVALREPLQAQGLDLEDIGFIEWVEDAFRAAVEEPLSALIVDQFSPLLALDVGLNDTPRVQAHWGLRDVSIAPSGMVLDYSVWSRPGRVRRPGRGRLVMSDRSAPTYSNPVSVAYSVNSINHVLYNAWQTGALSGQTEMYVGRSVTVRPHLPPIVQPEGENLQVRIGELALRVSDAETDAVHRYAAVVTAQVFPDLSYAAPEIRIDPLGAEPVPPELEAAAVTFVWDSLERIMPTPKDFVPSEQSGNWLTAEVPE